MAERDLTAELRHRRQHRRATTTILVVMLMLFFAFWYAFSYYRASVKDRGRRRDRPWPAAAPTTPRSRRRRRRRSTSTTRRPATVWPPARRASCAARGFTIGDVRNDPLDRTVAAAEVRFGPAGHGPAPRSSSRSAARAPPSSPTSARTRRSTSSWAPSSPLSLPLRRPPADPCVHRRPAPPRSRRNDPDEGCADGADRAVPRHDGDPGARHRRAHRRRAHPRTRRPAALRARPGGAAPGPGRGPAGPRRVLAPAPAARRRREARVGEHRDP